MKDIFETTEYKLIQKHYGDRTTKRSDVELINHIHEGLMILDLIIHKFSYAREAYCLHPLLQSDEDLQESLLEYGFTTSYNDKIQGKSFIFAMEYRHIANAYLSHRNIESIEEIQLSSFNEVNHMLIADKVQNRKDFELYHENTHPRSAELKQYFKNWLDRLSISEQRYQYYKKVLEEAKQWELLPSLSWNPEQFNLTTQISKEKHKRWMKRIKEENYELLDSKYIVFVFQDKNIKHRFRLDLLNSDYQKLHSHIIENENGGSFIQPDKRLESGYLDEDDMSYVFDTYLDGESFRGSQETLRIDFSEWMTF